MALTIRERALIGVGKSYDVFSGEARIGYIQEQQGIGSRSVFQWGLAASGPSSGFVAPSFARAKEGVRLAWDEWLRKAALAEAEPPQIPPLSADAVEADIDAVLAEFGGDARATIGALLHDIGMLAMDAQAVVSKGYVRGIAFSSARARKVGE